MTVVTGAAGHVGGNLVRALLEQGRQVRAVVRNDRRAIEGLDVEVVQADVLDLDSLVQAFRGADTVFHLAAQISIVGDMGGKVTRVNTVGPRNVVEACQRCGVRRLVHFSSIHAYVQEPTDKVLDETRALSGPKAPAYDRSKASGQQIVLQAAREKRLDAVVVNPTAVIGPHDYKPSRMGAVILSLARRRFPALVAGGFDWVDVRDVVAGAIAAEQKGRSGENYLLSGHYRTVADLGSLVEKVTGMPAPRVVVPLWLAGFGALFALAFSRITGGVPLFTPEAIRALNGARFVSHEKASQELGYSPRPLDVTVSDTVQWFKSVGML